MSLLSHKDPQDATITVRIIRNFEYRTIQPHVFRHVDLTKWTVADLIAEVKQVVATTPGLRPYRTVDFNAAKVYSHAHQTKTQNLAINLDKDDDSHWNLSLQVEPRLSLADSGVMNETEISVFNGEAYQAFKANPVMKWE